MKKRLPQISLLFLLLLPLLGRAQEIRITGRVVDAKTKKPIPFASICLHEIEIGTLSNERGYFQITGELKNQQDSLTCMALGYGRKATLIKVGQTDSLRFEMEPRQFDFTVTSGPCGVAGKNSVPLSEIERINGAPGTQYAFYFKSINHKRYGNLRELSIYTGSSGFPVRKFRLHIYETGKVDSAPGNDLLNENIVLLPYPREGWNNWDLSSFNIRVPEKGYFVALEFAALDEPVVNLWAEYFPYAQVMRPSFNFKKPNIWNYSEAQGWKQLPATESISPQYNAMLKVFVDQAN